MADINFLKFLRNLQQLSTIPDWRM